MANPLVQSLDRNFEQALRMMEAAVSDCPDTLWEADLWPEEAPTGPTSYGGLHGWAPWFLAYHALFTLDYDLTSEFESWKPPPPFDENTFAFPNRVFNKVELLGYVDYCRVRARVTLGDLSGKKAARPLPDVHRDHGTLYGLVVGGIPLHVLEHATQIRQFLAASGVKVRQCRAIAGTCNDLRRRSGHVPLVGHDHATPSASGRRMWSQLYVGFSSAIR